MYIEKSLVSINKVNKEIYQNIINKRLTECDKDSQRKRLEKSLKQIIKYWNDKTTTVVKERTSFDRSSTKAIPHID